MKLDDLHRIGSEAKHSAFRLETLSQYLVPQEAESFAKWQMGKPPPPRTPEDSAVIAQIKRDAERGFRRYRVHILDQPLTAYLRFELYMYFDSVAAGSEVYVADRHDHAELVELHEDFWLFDDEVAIRMIYDDEGRFLFPEPTDNIEAYRRMRDTALRHSEPLASYMARKQLTRESLTMSR